MLKYLYLCNLAYLHFVNFMHLIVICIVSLLIIYDYLYLALSVDINASQHIRSDENMTK